MGGHRDQRQPAGDQIPREVTALQGKQHPKPRHDGDLLRDPEWRRRDPARRAQEEQQHRSGQGHGVSDPARGEDQEQARRRHRERKAPEPVRQVAVDPDRAEGRLVRKHRQGEQILPGSGFEDGIEERQLDQADGVAPLVALQGLAPAGEADEQDRCQGRGGEDPPDRQPSTLLAAQCTERLTPRAITPAVRQGRARPRRCCGSRRRRARTPRRPSPACPRREAHGRSPPRSDSRGTRRERAR